MKVNIPAVNYKAQDLRGSEHYILDMDRIDENHHAADDAEIPESYRDHYHFLFFRSPPLHAESQEKNELSREPEYDPWI